MIFRKIPRSYQAAVIFLGTILGLIFSTAQAQTKPGVLVIFRYKPAYPAQSVVVAGSFNRWSKTANPLTFSKSDSTWQTRLTLPFGRYEYRFLVDGKRWMRDPNNPNYGGKNSNSLLIVKNPLDPEVRLLSPKPGVELRKFPVVIRALFHSGSSGAWCNPKKSFVVLDQTNRYAVSFADTILSCQIDALADGFHQFKIFVTDVDGRSARPIWSGFVVNRFNQPPVASSGPTCVGFVKQPAPFHAGTSFDPDMDPLKVVSWKISSGDSKTVPISRTIFPEYKFFRADTFYMNLQVSDSLAKSKPDSNQAFILKTREYPTRFMISTLALHLPRDSVKSISLVGEFNNWQVGKTLLADPDSNGIYETDMNLPPGEYEYKFVINGKKWIPDPINPRQIPDGWNGFNSLRTVQKPPLPEIRWKARARGDSIFLDASDSYDPMGRPLKIAWIVDRHNPEKLVLSQTLQTHFREPAKDGAYFIDLVLSADDRTAKPQTILFKKTETETRLLNFQESPAWGRDAIIYELYVRNFSKSRGLRGVQKNLKYLTRLGVNTIWLMPIFESPTDHGYNPTNFRRVRADYGTNQDLQDLIADAHKRGIRVILDFITNHTSDQHPYFKTAYRNEHSIFRNWFLWKGRYSYDYYNDWDAFPNLNYGNPNVWHFMIENALFWQKMGVDGYRCDVAWGVPHKFWKTFRRTLKGRNPDFLLLNEVLPRSPAYHDEEFDMSYDTDFYGNLLDVLNGKKPLMAIDEGFKKTAMNYPPGTLSLRYLENHDLKRFIRQFGAKRTQLAAVLLFTIPGTPLLFYGQEFGSAEQYPVLNKLDEFSPWFRFYRKLIHLRIENAAFSREEMDEIQTDLPDKVYAYLRQKKQVQFLVALNFDSTPQKVTLLFAKEQLLSPQPERAEWERVFPRNSLKLPYSAAVKVSLKAYGFAVFKLKTNK